MRFGPISDLKAMIKSVRNRVAGVKRGMTRSCRGISGDLAASENQRTEWTITCGFRSSIRLKCVKRVGWWEGGGGDGGREAEGRTAGADHRILSASKNT